MITPYVLSMTFTALELFLLAWYIRFGDSMIDKNFNRHTRQAPEKPQTWALFGMK